MSEQQLKKAIIIDHRLLRPLPKAGWNVACGTCSKPQARWEMGPPIEQKVKGSEPVFVCAVCFLYESEWSVGRAGEVEALIEDIERERNTKHLRDPEGRLFPKDADSILAAIALASQTLALRDRLSGLGRSQ
jgi:hypothetical protein